MRREKGFTLIELLVAVVMSVILLAALWTLLRIYTDLFDEGQARVEEAQLARALLLQMADDLRSAVQDPVAGVAPPPSTGPQRRFGLFGTSQELRFDVLQLPPPEVVLPDDDPAAPDTESETEEPVAPDLKTIYYGFTPPEVEEAGATGASEEFVDLPPPPADPSEEPLDAPPPGLVRREQGYGTDGPEPSSDEALVEPPEETLVTEGGEEASADDGAGLRVPEVIACEFRYFDGSGWSSQWNSIEQGALPVAVEITLRLGDPAAMAEEESLESSDTEFAELAEPSASADFEMNAEAALDGEEPLDLQMGKATAPANTYRLVVDLPGSPKHPAPEVVALADEPTAVAPPPILAPRAPTPRIAPPRFTPAAPPNPQRLPDQWMRNAP